MSIGKKILESFKSHAQALAPDEACALVIQVGRKQKLIICENTFVDPEGKLKTSDAFEISPEDWAEAEEQGDIIRVLHSHPGEGCTAQPSDMDKQQCNQSGVIWGIYAVESGEYSEIEPGGAPLIGRPFLLGSWDCYGLVMDWHKTQGVSLQDFRVPYPWWERGENLYMDNWKGAGFVEVPPGTLGAMVIMQVEASVPNHAGIYVGENVHGIPELLHHLYGQLSQVIPFKSGYFRERAVIWLKHKDLTEVKSWR